MKRLTAILCAMVVCACARQPQLIILHTNDTHSHLEPFVTSEGIRGGCIERAAFVDSVRAAEGADRVLLLHAGDFSQGTSYFTELKGELEPRIINAMGYDVVTLGNHEFDNDIEQLEHRLRQFKSTKVVCANIDFSAFPIGEIVKPYAIVEKNGLKIGVIGLLTDVSGSISKNVSARMQQLDNVEVVNKWAAVLRQDELCDLVILLSHIGYEEDQKLVPQTHNLDLVVGGHSHTFTENMICVPDADGRKVPVVTDGCFGQQMGKITIR